MVCYSLDPENPTKSCKSRGSNLCVHFKNTHETAQDIKSICIQKPPSIWKMSPCRNNGFHSVITGVELVGVPRSNRGVGHRAGGPKRVLSFCCTCLKTQRVSNADLKGEGVVLWSLSPSRWTRLPRCSTEFTELMGRLTHTRALPTTLRWPYWKRAACS